MECTFIWIRPKLQFYKVPFTTPKVWKNYSHCGTLSLLSLDTIKGIADTYLSGLGVKHLAIKDSIGQNESAIIQICKLENTTMKT